MSGSLGPSVLDGEVRYVSPSQMDRYDENVHGGCQRRWWFRHVAGREEPGTVSTNLGQQVHAQVEHYLKTGEDVLGDVARAGRRFLPRPGDDLLVEVGFGEAESERGPVRSPVTAAGVPVVGRVDLIHAREELVGDDGVARPAPGVVEVLDWKTTSRVDDEVDPDTGLVRARGWAKSDDEVARTWQMTAYGMVGLAAWPEATHVALSHGYFQTRGRRAAVKRGRVLAAQTVRERWVEAGSLVEAVVRVATAPRVDAVPANLAACSAYGGCPHRAVCPRDSREVLVQLLGGGRSMSLLAKMKAKREAEAAGSTATVSAPAPTVTVAAASHDPKVVAEEVAKLVAEEAAAITPPDAPAPSAIAELPEATPGACHLDAQVELDVKAVATKKYSCRCGRVFKVKPVPLADGHYYGVVKAHDPSEVKVVEAKVEAKVEPKVEPPRPPMSDPSTVVEKNPDFEVGGKTKPYIFLVDAVGDFHCDRLETYACELAATLATEFGAADVRCAKSDGPLGFGKWRGALAAAAVASPPAPGAYSVSSSSELATVVLEALLSKAAVIRGVK